MAKGGIFICYRREDSVAYAGRLYDRLAAHFGKNRVFMDVDPIEPGEDFAEVIGQTIAECYALIAVIGKSWVFAADDAGVRRLDNPEDYVRLEITAALKLDVRVIPALVGGAVIPRSMDLPDDMKALRRRNAIEISDAAFSQGVAMLIETLESDNRIGQRFERERSRVAQQSVNSSDRPDIFLSYATPDRAIAKTLATALSQQGFRVWWDRKIPPGKNFYEVIEQALKSARCVVVLWTKESAQSDWVRAEAAEGLQRRILVPVMIEEVDKIPFVFKNIQAANLADWHQSPDHPEFQSLLSSVADIVRTSSGEAGN